MRLPLAFSVCSLVAFGAVASCVGDAASTAPDSGSDAASSGGDASPDAGEGADGSVTDAGADTGADTAPADAGTDAKAPLCDLAKAFGTPQKLANVDTIDSEDSIWLTADQLNAYVSSRRPSDFPDGGGGYDLYTTTRAAVTSPFGALTPLPGPINTPQDQRNPIISADGLTLYYYSTETGGGQIYVASRAQTNVAFGAGQPVTAPLNAAAGDNASWLSADALTIFIASSRSATGRIYVATRASTGVDFQTPTTSGMPSTTGQDESMIVTADQLTAYFASTVTGGLGNYDVWKATRTSTADGFGAPVHVPELSSGNIDAPIWVSPEGCTIYFATEQAGMSGVYDLFVATKPL